MESPASGEHEMRAVEIAGSMVEHLRATGNFVGKYDGEHERKIFQRAGRIAKATVRPRKLAFRSAGGTFAAWWVYPTPLEREMSELRARDAVDEFFRGTAPED
ncbi:hypothetical protein ACIBF1_05420 [Spirillospora sp. NPDC050679]